MNHAAPHVANRREFQEAKRGKAFLGRGKGGYSKRKERVTLGNITFPWGSYHADYTSTRKFQTDWFEIPPRERLKLQLCEVLDSGGV